MNNYKKVFNYSKEDIINFIEQKYIDKNTNKFETPSVFNHYLINEEK